MDAAVSAERGGVEETLVTLRAVVGAHPLVNQLVSLQAARIAEDCRALGTLVGFFSCKDRVCHEALGTLVGFFSCKDGEFMTFGRNHDCCYHHHHHHHLLIFILSIP